MILPPWIYAAAGGAVLLTGFGAGWTVRDWRCDAAEARRLEAEIAARARAAKQAHDASTTFETVRADLTETAGEVRTTIREIYRDVPVNADCAADPASLAVLRRARDAANRAATGEPVGPVRDDPAAP